MKKYFIIILLWPMFLIGQESDTHFTEDEIIAISETLDSLYYLDSINNEIISQQETLISELETIAKLDSIELMYINKKIELLNNNIELYIQREKYLKPKWYDNKVIWFASGIITAVATGKMAVEVLK
jgi:primase-polymerase (primpol)-like protein